jgi:hypothetical protein
LSSVLNIAWILYWDWFLLPVFVLIAWFWPTIASSAFERVERFGSKIATRKAAVVMAIIVSVIAIRVSLLRPFPLRPPGIQDEFSYLLAGDTFAHGRLSNPPHAMALYLDSFNELFTPTYASMYEPGQGAFLAIGQKLGHPWIGVLLSTAFFLGALLWMLQGWVPPGWALFGALLPLLRFGIFSYWMNTFWGGAVAALGGCLVLGAYPRLLRRRNMFDAVVLGVGVALVANSRPYEGLLTLLPLAFFFLRWLLRKRAAWPALGRNVVLPLLLIGLITGSFMLYYNWRVTKSPLLFPHRLYERRFMSMSIFIWPEQGPVKHYANPQFDTMFSHYSRNQYRRSWPEFERITWEKTKDFAVFYLGPAGLAAFIVFPWVLLDRKTKLVRWMLLSACMASLGAIWFSPHYAAPALGALMILVVQMFRHLRRWQFRGRPVGIGLTRALATLALLTFIVQGVQIVRHPYAPLPYGWGWWGLWDREAAKSQLEKIPGNHLVIVRYSATTHFIHREWVYNDADIDASRVVWAREIPGVSMQPLLDYYHDRKVWLVEADTAPRTLVPYADVSKVAALGASISPTAAEIKIR